MFIRASFADSHVEELFKRRLDPKRMPHGGKVRAPRQQVEWQRKAARLRARADELTRALDQLADQRYVKGSLEADEYERQFSRWSVERAKALEDADELDAMAENVRPLDRSIFDVWEDAPLEVKQAALRRVIGRIEVKPSPRTGIGQEAFTGQRLRVVWNV